MTCLAMNSHSSRPAETRTPFLHSFFGLFSLLTQIWSLTPFSFSLFVLRQVLSYIVSSLVWNLPCGSHLPWVSMQSPTLAFLVLRLKVCTTTAQLCAYMVIILTYCTCTTFLQRSLYDLLGNMKCKTGVIN